MARTLRNAKIDTRSARSKLPAAKTIYWVPLTHGHALGYRKGAKGGAWVAKYVMPDKRLEKTLGSADDLLDANGDDILSHKQAQDKAQEWFASLAMPPAATASAMTLAEALDIYEADLETRGGDVGNVDRLRQHIPQKLLDKAIPTLTAAELRDWRDGLCKNRAPATVNRTCNAFKAAFNLAADRDETILTRNAWEKGLASLPDAEEARNVILSEAMIKKIVLSATQESAEFGLLVEVAAVTGARYGQITGLLVGDLQDDREEPRLMMPSSKKGKGTKKVLRRPIPISATLATKLRKAAGNRAITAPLLLRPDGGRWQKSHQSRPFERAVAAAQRADLKEGTKPQPQNAQEDDRITLYALRHSSIVRQILRGVPVRVIAVMHDTSVAMIEKNYSKFLADHSDAIARAALFEVGELVEDRGGGADPSS